MFIRTTVFFFKVLNVFKKINKINIINKIISVLLIVFSLHFTPRVLVLDSEKVH